MPVHDTEPFRGDSSTTRMMVPMSMGRASDQDFSRRSKPCTTAHVPQAACTAASPKPAQPLRQVNNLAPLRNKVASPQKWGQASRSARVKASMQSLSWAKPLPNPGRPAGRLAPAVGLCTLKPFLEYHLLSKKHIKRQHG